MIVPELILLAAEIGLLATFWFMIKLFARNTALGTTVGILL